MAKDAKGHGSEKRGAPTTATIGGHQVGVMRVRRNRLDAGQGPIFRVQAMVPDRQLVGAYRTLKAVDSSAASPRPSAKAEMIAKGLRVDNPDTLYRVRTGKQGIVR